MAISSNVFATIQQEIATSGKALLAMTVVINTRLYLFYRSVPEGKRRGQAPALQWALEEKHEKSLQFHENFPLLLGKLMV